MQCAVNFGLGFLGKTNLGFELLDTKSRLMDLLIQGQM